MKSKITELAKRRGLFLPSFEIYGGASGFYDYGPIGALIKNNIEQVWRSKFVLKEGLFEISSPNIGIEDIFIASGHAKHFVDPIIKCKKCGKVYRADHLIEEYGIKTQNLSIKDLSEIIRRENLRCISCKGELSDIESFNLMFATYIGADSKKAYLRPETAQHIFILFNRLYEINRKKLPLGVAQIGRAYRNEISPRQALIRLREFSQAEIEYFVFPSEKKHERFSEIANIELKLLPAENEDEIKISVKKAVENGIIANELLAYFIARTYEFLREVGIPSEKIRFRQHEKHERAHYAIDCWDAEVLTQAFSWIEVVGIADRGDYDLKAHSKMSGKKLTAFDGEKHVIPHVVEPSFGIDRIFHCIIETAYRDDGKRKFLKLKPNIAPYLAAVFPLLTKEELIKKSHEVFALLKNKNIFCYHDVSGSIGRRYARADEIGVAFSITADFQTLEDDSITIRERDTTEQKRVNIKELAEILIKLRDGEIRFNKL